MLKPSYSACMEEFKFSPQVESWLILFRMSSGNAEATRGDPCRGRPLPWMIFEGYRHVSLIFCDERLSVIFLLKKVTIFFTEVFFYFFCVCAQMSQTVVEHLQSKYTWPMYSLTSDPIPSLHRHFVRYLGNAVTWKWEPTTTPPRVSNFRDSWWKMRTRDPSLLLLTFFQVFVDSERTA